MTSAVIWIPPPDLAPRALGIEPGGGRPSLAWVLDESLRETARGRGANVWGPADYDGADQDRNTGLLLEFHDKRCVLSYARAGELLDDPMILNSSCSSESLAALLVSTFGGNTYFNWSSS